MDDTSEASSPTPLYGAAATAPEPAHERRECPRSERRRVGWQQRLLAVGGLGIAVVVGATAAFGSGDATRYRLAALAAASADGGALPPLSGRGVKYTVARGL